MRRVVFQLILIILPLIFVFTLIVAVIATLFPITNRGSGPGMAQLSRPTASPVPVPTFNSFVPKTATTSFRSTGLGFELEYPTAWRRKESTLRVIFSPSLEGLDRTSLQDGAFWVGVPASEINDPVELLQLVLSEFTEVTILNQGSTDIASQSWHSAQISFADQQGVATVVTTSKNQVGYFMVAAAPADQWDTLRPIFQQTINSFRFTEEAVLRPTDATPPPTPTPTPTPIIYVVQSGDSLGKIAAQFGVDIEILSDRNDIDDARFIRTGQQLIIPRPRY